MVKRVAPANLTKRGFMDLLKINMGVLPRHLRLLAN